MVYVIILATVMAIFGVIGYTSGARAAFFTTLMTVLGLLLVSRAGGSIARVINGLYFGIRFVLAGGLQALGGSGDKSAAVTKVIQSMGSVKSLLSPDTPGVEMVAVVLLLVMLSVWLGRSNRLKLRGHASSLGLLWGIVSGYLIGAYLLVSLVPAEASFLVLPFGLGHAGNASAPPTNVPATSGADLITQLSRSIQNASQNTLAIVVMLLIAVLVLVAVLTSTRGAHRSK